jgi:maltose O-acetyltransferase
MAIDLLAGAPSRDTLGRLRDTFELWRYRRKVEHWKRSGVRFGRGVIVMPTAVLDVSLGWLIEIGDRVRIGHQARILVHDASAQRDLGHGRVGPVRIGDDSLIAERVTVLPGVTIGRRVMVAVGSVVATDLPDNVRAMGVPARAYGTFDDYLEETRRAIASSPLLTDEELSDRSPEGRARVIERLRRAGGKGYRRDTRSESPYYATPP